MPSHHHKQKRLSERFSVLIVPRNRSQIRRFQLSRVALYAVTAGVVAFLVLCVVGLGALLHFRSSYYATEDVRVEAARYVRERASLLGRLAELEGAVARTDRFAAKLESEFARTQAGKVGHGPVSEGEWLPMPQRVASIKRSLGEGIWKSPLSKSFTAGLTLTLDELAGEVDAAEERIHALFERKQEHLHFWASLPSVWPTRGWVTSGFGALRSWGGRKRVHEGIDIAGPRGTPIVVPGDGVVTYRGYKGGYGRTLVVDHGYGISTLYGHCSQLYVNEGQHVRRGMIIATVGNTGRSTGPHLHYEVRVDGVPVDPMMYIVEQM